MKNKKIPLLIFGILLLSAACASSADISGEPIPDRIDLKYPIIMVHGIGRHDRGPHKKSWDGIPGILQRHGLEVYYGNTDAWGTIETNSDILKATIDKILDETHCGKVNIIAHSKGGIDSRYMIWRYNYGDKVASLTTIDTPHYGSEIADLFFNSKIIHRKSIRKRLESIGKLYGDEHPNIYEVNAELTVENMREFSEYITPDHNVFYQSIYTVMAKPGDDPYLATGNRYLKSKGLDNDGLVSDESAQWGPHVIRVPGSVSHEQIIGYGGKKIRGGIIPDIYLEIAEDLSRLGF
ncbi:MAG: hypothetical protein FWF29_01105 [Treponema sp.]|nr:hypothetical protein [Treponema sp.]